MLDPNNPYASAMPVESQGDDPNRSGAWVIPSLDSAASPVLALLRTVASAYIQLALGIAAPMFCLVSVVPKPDWDKVALLPVIAVAVVAGCLWAWVVASLYWSMRRLIPQASLAWIVGAMVGAGLAVSAVATFRPTLLLDDILPAAAMGAGIVGALAGCVRMLIWVLPGTVSMAIERAEHAMRHPRGQMLAAAFYGRAAALAADETQRERVELGYRKEYEDAMVRSAGRHRTPWISWAGLFLFVPAAGCGALVGMEPNPTTQTIAGLVVGINVLVALVLVIVGIADAIVRRHLPVRENRPLRWVIFWLLVAALSMLYVNLGRTMRQAAERRQQQEMRQAR